MAIFMVRTVTKPSDAKWFSRVEPIKWNDINDWVKTFPGIIGTKNVNETADKSIKTFIFQDMASLNSWVDASRTHENYCIREQYYLDNNFTSEIKITEE